jgi:hypothetical protein
MVGDRSGFSVSKTQCCQFVQRDAIFIKSCGEADWVWESKAKAVNRGCVVVLYRRKNQRVNWFR